MADNYQMNIFGEFVTVESVEESKRETIKSRFRKMYGFDETHQCRNCKHLSYTERDRRYYKCLLMGISASEATDIRLKDIACKRWERKEE